MTLNLTPQQETVGVVWYITVFVLTVLFIVCIISGLLGHYHVQTVEELLHVPARVEENQ